MMYQKAHSIHQIIVRVQVLNNKAKLQIKKIVYSTSQIYRKAIHKSLNRNKQLKNLHKIKILVFDTGHRYLIINKYRTTNINSNDNLYLATK